MGKGLKLNITWTGNFNWACKYEVVMVMMMVVMEMVMLMVPWWWWWWYMGGTCVWVVVMGKIFT